MQGHNTLDYADAISTDAYAPPSRSRSMSQMSAAAGAIVERIKINAISREIRNGRAVWIKKRRPIAAPIMACANRFFCAARTPVRAIADRSAWQQWEVGCFERLHQSEGFHAYAEGAGSVAADEMPGINLTRHLDGGSLTPEMTATAARELLRAHSSRCSYFGDFWSHGDPHIGNFIYDQSSSRARLIDFEMMHDRSLPAIERHSDDLLVFLQDMVGRISADRWLPCALAFLQTYDRPEAIDRLQAKLRVPEGCMPRLWWQVRTTFLPEQAVRARFTALKEALTPSACPA